MSELIYVDKNCPVCGKHFNEGRSDKTYCSTKCKNKSNNKKNRAKRKAQDKEGVKQRRNERILKGILEGDIFKWDHIPYALLQFRGYDFDVAHDETEDPETGRFVRCNGSFGLSINDDNTSYRLHLIDGAGNVAL
ncbi:MAG: hypothetical protein EOO06_13060 [Chitinophagaceae bacterium]|nr:MAG: hypothetical protein EOO06_13060 [Chitinophagaceae bacterium]